MFLYFIIVGGAGITLKCTADIEFPQISLWDLQQILCNTNKQTYCRFNSHSILVQIVSVEYVVFHREYKNVKTFRPHSRDLKLMSSDFMELYFLLCVYDPVLHYCYSFKHWP